MPFKCTASRASLGRPCVKDSIRERIYSCSSRTRGVGRVRTSRVTLHSHPFALVPLAIVFGLSTPMLVSSTPGLALSKGTYCPRPPWAVAKPRENSEGEKALLGGTQTGALSATVESTSAAHATVQRETNVDIARTRARTEVRQRQPRGRSK